MRYIESTSHDPYFNLALEQYVFDNLSKNDEYFMLWQNNNAIIIGKHQNAIAEINHEYVKENNISVVRRLSGGGAVYHDLGNLNFTFIVNDDANSKFDFSKFCNPIVKALKELNVHAELNGRNDMTIDGKKFSGNSQYAKKNKVMHHGTIMYNSDIGVVASSLKVSKDKIESKGIKSIRSRVTNVKDYMLEDIPIEEFKKSLLQLMFDDNYLEAYTLTAEDICAIEKIKDEKYSTWDWNFGSSPRYNVLKERRFEGCGKIELYMEVNNGVIEGLNIFGDYFGNGDSLDIVSALIGCKIEENQITNALKYIDVTNYFNNLNKDELVQLIVL